MSQDRDEIYQIAYQLAANGKGILAADESTATITKRFDSINLESTPSSRALYREMLFTSNQAISNYISGAILYEETLEQSNEQGVALRDMLRQNGALIGIKVDKGAKKLAAFSNETITEGLDNLRESLARYYQLGARFAKWRAVIAIDKTQLPTRSAICQNAQALARYASLCQEAKIVPIIEPEVLMDGQPGDHDIDRCFEVTSFVLHKVFAALYEARVDIEAIVLKPNMVIDGQKIRRSGQACASVAEVAEKTVKCLKAHVPALVPSISFLSGGQSDIEATEHLNAINAGFDLPWQVSFSYGRALQAAALKIWQGQDASKAKAQAAFSHRAKMNYLAAKGQWHKAMEEEGANFS